MREVSDKEYLSRPKIETTFEITDDYIRIYGHGTSHCNVFRCNKLVQKEVLGIYTQINRIAKEKKEQGYKVTISKKYKYRQALIENWGKYEEEVDYYNKLYEDLKKQARVIEKRGVHECCSDDKELKKLYKIENDMTVLCYRTTTKSKVESICGHFQDALMSVNEVGRFGIVGCTVYL